MDLNMRILVGDDVGVIRGAIRRILRNIGFTDIKEADGGKAVLRSLEKGRYDLVLCDWNMPDISGLDVLKEIRSDDKLRDVPFIMVTAEAREDSILEAVEAGVNGYIVKPFSANTLREKMKEIFGA